MVIYIVVVEREDGLKQTEIWAVNWVK